MISKRFLLLFTASPFLCSIQESKTTPSSSIQSIANILADAEKKIRAYPVKFFNDYYDETSRNQSGGEIPLLYEAFYSCFKCANQIFLGTIDRDDINQDVLESNLGSCGNLLGSFNFILYSSINARHTVVKTKTLDPMFWLSHASTFLSSSDLEISKAAHSLFALSLQEHNQIQQYIKRISLTVYDDVDIDMDNVRSSIRNLMKDGLVISISWILLLEVMIRKKDNASKKVRDTDCFQTLLKYSHYRLIYFNRLQDFVDGNEHIFESSPSYIWSSFLGSISILYKTQIGEEINKIIPYQTSPMFRVVSKDRKLWTSMISQLSSHIYFMETKLDIFSS